MICSTSSVRPRPTNTAQHSVSLTHETKTIVRQVHHKVKVTVFLRRDEPGRVEAATLLARYHRLNRHITFKLLDPDWRLRSEQSFA